jgi:hypothetical protein
VVLTAPLVVPPRVDLFDLPCERERPDLATCRVAVTRPLEDRTVTPVVR